MNPNCLPEQKQVLGGAKCHMWSCRSLQDTRIGKGVCSGLIGVGFALLSLHGSARVLELGMESLSRAGVIENMTSQACLCMLYYSGTMAALDLRRSPRN